MKKFVASAAGLDEAAVYTATDGDCGEAPRRFGT